jgi:acyl-CoA synthetase (AMP-forming)/AMP-acid ligase II
MYPGDFAATKPDHPAVIQAATGEVTTYQQLHDAAVRLSNVLRDAGLAEGDHVALCLENHPRYLEIVWGCHYAGLIYTACSSRLTKAELSYIINDCKAKAYITSKYKSEQALEIANDIPNVHLRLMLDGTVKGYDSFESAVSAASSVPLPNMVDGTDMLYSSGTTGMPKGISRPLPGTKIGEAGGVINLASLLFAFDETTIYLSPAPLYHAAPLRFNLAVHMLGGTTVVMDHFDAEEYLKAVEKYKTTKQSQLVPQNSGGLNDLKIENSKNHTFASDLEDSPSI